MLASNRSKLRTSVLRLRAFMDRPAISLQLLARERSHFGGNPKNAVVQLQQCGGRHKSGDARRPRYIVDRSGHYNCAVLIVSNQHSRSLNSGNRTLLLAPLIEHAYGSSQETCLVLRHHVAQSHRRGATARNVAETFEVFDHGNLQTQRDRGIANEGGDLLLRQSKILELFLNEDNQV